MGTARYPTPCDGPGSDGTGCDVVIAINGWFWWDQAGELGEPGLRYCVKCKKLLTATGKKPAVGPESEPVKAPVVAGKRKSHKAEKDRGRAAAEFQESKAAHLGEYPHDVNIGSGWKAVSVGAHECSACKHVDILYIHVRDSGGSNGSG